MDSSGNYISILTESLKKKIGLLKNVLEICERQSELLSEDSYDDDVFAETIDEKEKLITKLLFLDNGFEATYNRIKSEIQANKDAHKEEIRNLQNLIRTITDLSNRIQATELRNDRMFRVRFDGARQKIKMSKASVKAVSGYYSNMMGAATNDAMFLDQKK